ncbi:hypothetical protein [Streptomonospora litoralis]|uniref:hypothetical protein n=1 Tax=Streptomonospora litoralis TaxID=2498135 RepID=UPI0013F171A1|nr:hypothetical protein [Streptomonospora litoralis]
MLLLQEMSEILTTQLSEQRHSAQEAQTEVRRARWIAVTSVIVGIVGMAFGLVEVLLSL